jgi:hypothetical protein
MTLSIMPLSIMPLCHYAECHCAEFLDLFIGMLNVSMMGVVRQNVVMLGVVRQNVVMLGVVAPSIRIKLYVWPAEKWSGDDLLPAVSFALTLPESTRLLILWMSPLLQASNRSLIGSMGEILRGSEDLDMFNLIPSVWDKYFCRILKRTEDFNSVERP